jgi:hypothetical protein
MIGHGAKFGRKKEEAVAALLTHRTVEDAAGAVGVAPGYLDPAFPTGYGRAVEIGKPVAPGMIEALVDQGEGVSVPISPPHAFTLTLSEAPAVTPILTLRKRI